jgi:hypothetical protein
VFSDNANVGLKCSELRGDLVDRFSHRDKVQIAGRDRRCLLFLETNIHDTRASLHRNHCYGSRPQKSKNSIYVIQEPMKIVCE